MLKHIIALVVWIVGLAIVIGAGWLAFHIPAPQ
jgi:hypothetical protein